MDHPRIVDTSVDMLMDCNSDVTKPWVGARRATQGVTPETEYRCMARSTDMPEPTAPVDMLAHTNSIADPFYKHISSWLGRPRVTRAQGPSASASGQDKTIHSLW